MRDEHEKDGGLRPNPLTWPVEIAPGEWKPLGECNAADMEDAAAIWEEKAKAWGRISDLLRELAALAESGPVNVPKWIRASAVQELAEANVPGFGRLVQERVEESLPELRTHLAELEAIVEAQR